MGSYHPKSYVYTQNTSEICMQCHINNCVNEDLRILRILKYSDDVGELFMRCSNGHLVKHCGSIKYIENCAVKLYENANLKITNKNKMLENEIKKLKNENKELKKQINSIPSAPPNEEIIVAEAVIEKTT